MGLTHGALTLTSRSECFVNALWLLSLQEAVAAQLTLSGLANELALGSLRSRESCRKRKAADCDCDLLSAEH